MQDVVIPDSKDLTPSDGFEIILAPLVFKATIVMAPAIELYYQSMRRAVEVGNVGPDGVLAAEFHAAKSAVA
jgi:hypothetical protein